MAKQPTYNFDFNVLSTPQETLPEQPQGTVQVGETDKIPIPDELYQGLKNLNDIYELPGKKLNEGIDKLQDNPIAGAIDIGTGIAHGAFTLTGIPQLFSIISTAGRVLGFKEEADNFDAVMNLPSTIVQKGTEAIDTGLEKIGFDRQTQQDFISKVAAAGLATGRPEFEVFTPLLTPEGQQEIANSLDEVNKLGATLLAFHGLGKLKPKSVKPIEVIRETQNVKEGNIAEGNIEQYPQRSKGGEITETSYRDKFEQSKEIEKILIDRNPSMSGTNSAVLSIIDNKKVLNSIVGDMSVDMVNMLSGKQFTPQMLLDNPSVFQKALTSNSNSLISKSAVDFLSNRVAFLGTELFDALSTGRYEKFNSTVLANNLSATEIMGLLRVNLDKGLTVENIRSVFSETAPRTILTNNLAIVGDKISTPTEFTNLFNLHGRKLTKNIKNSKPETSGGNRPQQSGQSGQEKIVETQKINNSLGLTNNEFNALNTGLMRQAQRGKITTQESFDILDGKIPYPTQKLGDRSSLIKLYLNEDIKYYKNSIAESFAKLEGEYAQEYSKKINESIKDLTPDKQLTKLKEVYGEIRKKGVALIGEILSQQRKSKQQQKPETPSIKKEQIVENPEILPPQEPVVAPNQRFYGYRNKEIKGTGELKQRGVSKTTEANAIEKGITEGFKDLPEYNVLQNKEQITKAKDFIEGNFENAKQVALGNVRAPNDILPEFIYKGVEAQAIQKGDVATLRDLATSSKLSTEATVMGQRIQALRNQDPLSPVNAMKDIIKTREERFSQGRDLTKVKEQNYQQIKTQIRRNAPKVNEWSTFLESIRC